MAVMINNKAFIWVPRHNQITTASTAVEGDWKNTHSKEFYPRVSSIPGTMMTAYYDYTSSYSVQN